MKSDDDRQLTIKQACERLGISRETLHQAFRAGHIARSKGSKAVRYWQSEVDRYGSNPGGKGAPDPTDIWTRTVAECIRRGIDPSDDYAVQGVTNNLMADDEREAIWRSRL